MSRLTRGTPRKEPFGAWLIILGVLVAGSAAAACIHGQAPSDPHLTMAPADEARAAAWQARPAYTHTTAATEAATATSIRLNTALTERHAGMGPPETGR